VTFVQGLRDASPQRAEYQIAVSRRLEVTDRAIIQLANSVVRGDPVKSLVELVTNSDDSYRRLACRNETSFGRIVVTIDKRQNTLTVLDFAEGIDVDSMDQCVGKYGGDVSGFSTGYNVRGFYGRGLKEAVLGLGSGKIQSIKQGFYNECMLCDDGMYLRRERRVASLSDYVDLGIPYRRSGTRIILLVAKGKKMPAFGWISYSLSNHVALRDIMQSASRRIILTDGERSEILTHKRPAGKLILQRHGIPIPGFDASLDLTVYTSDRPLAQEGYTRDGGIIVRSKNAIHDATLFKFDNSPYASKFFGELRCDYIEQLMSKGELVIDDKRDGLDPHHPFTKALRKAAESQLEPLVDHEMAKQAPYADKIDVDLKQRFDVALWEVNKLAARLMRGVRRYEHHSATHGSTINHPIKKLNKAEASRTGGSTCPILFKEIRFNSNQDPRVRVYLDKAAGTINIATRAPSVAMYYDCDKQSKEFLTLVAELVSDIVFFELACVVSNEMGGRDITDVYAILKNRYAHLIHRSMRGQDQVA
jgi:hypothetical protein